jgi:tRNA pseudouridine38-40 synthase
LDIAYDGTDFAGWGTQPTLRTVQGTLEDALGVIFRRQGEPPRLIVAGRTDAGVHATGQVAHLDLTPEHLHTLDRTKRSPRANNANNKGAPALVRRVNGILGLSSDVVVTAGSIAPEGFDARFSALWRRYEYQIADASVTKNPIRRNYVLAYPAHLDERAMDAAASALVGLHDWAAYCKPRERATTIRELQDFRWERDDAGILTARVKADAFCHSMVRSLVGACVAVGAGKLEPTDLMRLRDATGRSSEFKVMPAKGLTLVEVGYPADAELALRAAQTRTRRDAVAWDAEDGLE